MRQLRISLMIALGLSAQDLCGDETKLNVRELCRIDVSGAFMGVLNDIDIYEGQLAKAEDRVKTGRLRRLLLDREYQTLAQTLRNETPALEVDERILTLRFEQRTIEAQIRENEELIERFGKLLAERKTFREQFQKLIDPVFVVKEARDAPRGSYPIAVTYRHVCGQFQLLCPLPRDQADALIRLSAQLSHPQSCQRYSAIRAP